MLTISHERGVANSDKFSEEEINALIENRIPSDKCAEISRLLKSDDLEPVIVKYGLSENEAFMVESALINMLNYTRKDDPTKTCRDVGSRRRYDDKCKNDPIWQTYNRAYKAHYARYMKKKMTISEFEEWSQFASEIRD